MVLPPPGPTAVRIAGDRYQWLVAWQGCITALRDHQRRVPNPVTAVGVEVDEAGNLDDCVLYRRTPPHTYSQVKYAVDASTPVNETYLLAPSKTGGPSILRKITDAWRRLTAYGQPAELVLTSNRAADPSDPLVCLRDARTGLLLPRAAVGGPRSIVGKARARWAHITGLDDAELTDLLAQLRFDTGRDVQLLRDLTSLQMLAAGLRDDDEALDAGIDWIARQVRDGYQVVELSTIIDTVENLGLAAAGPARAVLSVATLKPDPLAANADYALDWVDRFDGATDFSKRRPLPPATWPQLQHDIATIPTGLPPGTTAVALTGSLRQATAFAVGAALRQVTGVTDLAVRQRGQLWSSDAPYDHPSPPEVVEHRLGQGDGLAVALAVAVDPTEEVLEFLHAGSVPVERLLVLGPPAGARDNAIPDPAAAIALAVGIRDLVRRASRRNSAVHLFLAGPMGLAALLGHRWNRIRPTVVYEDVRGPDTYEAAFNIDA